MSPQIGKKSRAKQSDFNTCRYESRIVFSKLTYGTV